MALPEELLLEGVPWILKQVLLLVFFEKTLDVVTTLEDVRCHDLDD